MGWGIGSDRLIIMAQVAQGAPVASLTSSLRQWVQVTIVVPADVGTWGRKCHLDVAEGSDRWIYLIENLPVARDWAQKDQSRRWNHQDTQRTGSLVYWSKFSCVCHVHVDKRAYTHRHTLLTDMMKCTHNACHLQSSRGWDPSAPLLWRPFENCTILTLTSTSNKRRLLIDCSWKDSGAIGPLRLWAPISPLRNGVNVPWSAELSVINPLHGLNEGR